MQKIQAAERLSRGKARLAISLIGHPQEVANAMFYVFGGTFICEDAETAKLITFSREVGVKCVTLDGDTDAATLACCDDSAACTAGGRAAPPGRARFSAHRTRIASRPDCGFPLGLPGVGVVERGSMSWVDRPFAGCFDLLFPSFQDILGDRLRERVLE